jgi:hypothetical protein
MVLLSLLLFLLTLIAIYFYVTLVLITPTAAKAGAQPEERVVYQEPEVSRPYMTNENQYGDAEDDLDWTETDFVREQEGGYNPTKDAINAARQQFPFDWANLPPSANEFQRQQMLYVKNAPKNQAADYNTETFKDIDAVDILPPDNMAEETREAKLLKSYEPVSASEFGAPTEQSVEELVKKIYKPRGLIPIVKQQGDSNIYEIYETKEINPKIVYEDDVQEKPNLLDPLTDTYGTVENFDGAVTKRGVAPKSVKTRAGRQSYSTYNPELELMFGPRMMWQQWG